MHELSLARQVVKLVLQMILKISPFNLLLKFNLAFLNIAGFNIVRIVVEDMYFLVPRLLSPFGQALGDEY